MALTYTDPNLESDPEDSPPVSQLEPRYKAELAKQRSNEGLRLQKERAYTILRNETKRNETKSGEIEQN